MLLVIDAGNTNTVFAIFEGNALKAEWRISSSAKRTSDEYAIWLIQLMQLQGLKLTDISKAICACVIPYALFDLKTLCKNYFKTELLVVGEGMLAKPIETNVDQNVEVGADRLVNSFAAWKKFACPAIVVDFGTATTFDVVGEKGCYEGGVIAPGVHLSLAALQQAAAKLPNVSITAPKQVIGKNTVSAMQSGIYFGYLGLIEGIVARLKESYGKPMKVVATGGLAALYAKSTKAIDEVDSDLTVWGLKELFHTFCIEVK